ncbi:MAG TPA: acyl-CoA dehydrogenase family protein [Acidimicrobiales bacterium]|nr:acyl-CoA dehydrogenase family protein [Acidimicrobiales bacterium]
MDFELTADQLALRDAARDLLDRAASPERVRKVVDAGGGYDAELWSAMVEQGWTDPEFVGVVEAAVLLEEVGRHVAPAPFLTQWLAASNDITAVVWDREAPALYAPSATHAIVRDGDVMRRVAITEPPRRESAMDRTREVGWLRDLDTAKGDVVCSAADMLDRAAVAFAAELLGVGARAMEMAVDYAKVREQFGHPIGSFQAVKHRCADMLVDVEGMRSAVYWAAWCVGAGDADASIAASTAKAWCADASKRVLASALQVHGGIGFTWEHDLHLYLKRAQLDQVSFGDAAFHRDRLASLLRDRVAAGESVI